MAIALSKQQEVSAATCVLYLRRKSVLITSHEFASVMLSQFMAIQRREEHKSVFVERKAGEYIGATQYSDFVHRPETLPELCVMEFVSKFSRVRVTNAKRGDVMLKLQEEEKDE